MTTYKLALRNLLGGGVKTWLRVGVLSLAFLTIIAIQGVYQGINEQGSDALIAAEAGAGQYWHEKYDPQDPLGLPDAHGVVPKELSQITDAGSAAAILIVQGFMYAGGNLRSVLLKGIEPSQRALSLPTSVLTTTDGEAPALIGTRMARDAGLKVGDLATIRWRDARGTFDAEEVRIVHVMNTSVQAVDSGQLWLPLDRLRRMARMEGEASLIVLGKDATGPGHLAGWNFKDQDFLLSDLRGMVQAKMVGASIIYLMLLFLAMLAVLDTQILSIFHRRKEIGTLMALGVTRGAVIRMFTLEGALNAVLAALAGAVYGGPLLVFAMRAGLPMPAAIEQAGFPIGERLYPAYGAVLVVGTTALVLIVTTIVSYLPTRRIAQLKPTDALRGKLA
ncbi:MAG: ABC transporter permease [Acidobacteria bacterium]|nr:MAG: ABC transporter permease [Acidobacteriota bacterium]